LPPRVPETSIPKDGAYVGFLASKLLLKNPHEEKKIWLEATYFPKHMKKEKT